MTGEEAVPITWPQRRLKTVARRIKGGATPSRTRSEYWGGDIVWVTPSDVSGRLHVRDSSRRLTAAGFAACSAPMAPPGSVVLTSRAPIGNAALAAVPLCTSQGCKTIVPDERVVMPKYAFAAIRALRSEFERMGDGTTFQEISTARVGEVCLPVPHFSDQALIVRYVDHLEFRVGRAIAAKRQLVNLLDERRRTATQDLVTQGAVLDGAMRESGIAWLGHVPARWDVRPAKWFYREVNERSERGQEQLMSVSHLTGVTPRAAKNVTMFMAACYAGHKLCRPGDLVINTMWAWMGALGVAGDTGIVSPAYGVYRPLPNSPLQPAYADLLLRTRPYIDEYTCRSTGIRSSRLRLYPDRFLTVPIVCPSVEEQLEIVGRVSEATRDLDAAIAATLREIELLQEYRTRLLADVVTGRREVRAEAVDLPDVDPDELDAVLSAASADDDVDEDDQE